ncbi:DMT family transporter [Maricaulis parjimensis]|uniref:DMT family transporter n=1 Tax=Maricaulis parjimensis TaxID=144023 RepID=UPI00193A6835|nr:DMT family transporter [Maricaulis parjimensis]
MAGEPPSQPHHGPHHGIDWTGFAIGLSAPAGWGLAGIFIRLLEGWPGALIMSGRLLVAALIFLPALILRHAARRDALRTALPLAMAAYYIIATSAFIRAPIVNVALLIGLSPAIALIIDRVGGIKPGPLQWLGVAVAITGLAIFLGPQEISQREWFGHALAVAAGLMSAIYATGLRRHHTTGRKSDPAVFTGLACLYGAILALLLWPVSGGILGPLTLPQADGGDFVEIVLLGLLATALPTLTYGVASSRLAGVITASLMLLSPIFASLYAGFILHAWPSLIAIPGGLMVLLGVFLTTRTPRPDETRHTRA